MTYQERLDRFAAHIATGVIANNVADTASCQKIFKAAQEMIEESDRICAEKKELGSNKSMTPLQQLIADNNLSYVYSGIMDENFPLVEFSETDLKVFHFYRFISSEEAIIEMEKEGYRAANIYELLTWNKTNEEDRFFVALGSFIQRSDVRDVPCLDLSDERMLDLFSWNGNWNGGFRFLAVKKYPDNTQPENKTNNIIKNMIYSYAELKGKIKVGDTVRAVAGLNNHCNKLKNDGSNTLKITRVDEDKFYINGCWHEYTAYGFLEIIDEPSEEPVERIVTWENLQKGDVIFDVNGNLRTILARIEDIVSLSYYDNSFHYDWYSIQQLRDNGYKIKTDKPKRKVTLAEIAEKFGEEVEVVE